MMKSPGAQCVILKLVARALRQPERGSTTISCILEILMHCFVLCSSSLKKGVELSILGILMCSLCLSLSQMTSSILENCTHSLTAHHGSIHSIKNFQDYKIKAQILLKFEKTCPDGPQKGPKLSKTSRLTIAEPLNPFGPL